MTAVENQQSRATRRRSTACAVAIALVTIGALQVAGPATGGASAVPAGNLVQNPGAEAEPGASDSNTTVTPSGWTTTGTFTSVRYNTPDFLTSAFASQIGGGNNFFTGGRNAPLSTATQTIDVSAAAVEIDAGGVLAKLSAYLGGYSSQPDSAMVAAVFLDAAAAELGTVKVGPVTPTERKSTTTLLLRSATAPVPAGTRTIRVVMTSTRLDGTYNDGYFDNIGLELATAPPPPPPPPTLALACAGHTLVATVRPGAGTSIQSVTFVLNGKSISIDRLAPFTVRIPTKRLAAQLHVSARVRSAGVTTVLTKARRRC